MTTQIADPEAAHILANLIRLRTQLAEHPESHDQNLWFHLTWRHPGDDEGALAVVREGVDSWVCATAACAAGWACLLAGDSPTSDSTVSTPAGLTTADVRGRELLGLDHDEAAELFSEENTSDEVLDFIDEQIRQRSQ
jgi:hypothetical protein